MALKHVGNQERSLVFAPEGAVNPKMGLRALVASIAFAGLAILVLWIGYYQAGFGRPQAWVQFVAPFGVAFALWALIVNTRQFLVALRWWPLCAIRTSPSAAVGGPVTTCVTGAAWRDISGTTIVTVDCRALRSRKGRVVAALRIEIEATDGARAVIALSGVEAHFDWINWTRATFAFAPEVKVRAASPST